VLIKSTLSTFLALILIASPVLAQQGKRTNDIEKRPGYQKPLDAVHPGWVVESVRPKGFEPQVGALAFSPDGKYLAVTSFPPSKDYDISTEPTGTLYVLENPTAKDPADMVVHNLGTELFSPLGARWLDTGLYIAERDQISRWTDGDGDGLPEKMDTFAGGWISDNYHHFTFGLPYKDGHFYAALSTSLNLSSEAKKSLKGKIVGGNAPNPEFRGCVMKVDAKTGEIEWLAGGTRTPNGVGFGPGGVLLVPDNQGDWKPSNCIYAVKGGEFLGKYNDVKATTIFYPDGGVPSMFSDKKPTPPAIWLPQNEIGNSPSATLLIPEGKPFAGQVLVADVTQGAIHRVFMQEVDGTWQGAAFRHTMGFEAGPNDIAWGPDGCLYAGHIGFGAGSSGKWGWKLKKFGLQRLRPTGKTAFEFEKIEAAADGFRVTFTQAVPEKRLAESSNWLIDAWTYKARPQYGGPKEGNHQVLVNAVKVSDDRKSVELIIPERKPNYCYHIRIDATNDAGQKMWSPEAWVTFHKAPSR